MKKLINCRGTLLDLSTPVVMGILNLTPDSFFDGGKFQAEQTALKHVTQLLEDGADIIDVGAQSTRPKSALLSAEEEWKRLGPVLPSLVRSFPQTIFSIDTFYATVAERAVGEGASIVNDISGGSMDSRMFDTIARLQVPYILMHMQGTPQTMQDKPEYQDVVVEVMDYFISKIHFLRSKGVHDIIVDPGFGFGKNAGHNFQLLNKLDLFCSLNCPVLAGLSRKSMISKVTGIRSQDALNGTTVLNTIALMKGAHLLRVHDVQEAREAVLLFNRLSGENLPA